MKFQVFPTDEAVAYAAAQFLKDLAVNTVGRLNSFLPTGSTPRPFYKKLLAYSKFWASKLAVTQIDDYFAEEANGLFKEELEKLVIKPLGLESQFASIPAELDMFLEFAQKTFSHPPRVAVLGLGPNGHVGFHEPHLPPDFSFGRVELGSTTIKHLLAYNLKMNSPQFDASKTVIAHSFGVGTFQKCKTVVMIVTGNSKREILKRLLTENPSGKIPGSLLKGHSDFHIFADEAAAGSLKAN